ncbi:MAG: alpha/beta hydrolase [Pseudomonadota bacterium]|nr:alpha/beta hydrolase [Pseudomonadota bacterium]
MVRIGILLLSVYLLFVLALYAAQRSFLYFPDRTRVAAAAAGFAGAMEHVLVTSDGERIIVWNRLADRGKPTVIFFHGNAGSIADRRERWTFLNEKGYGALFVSYRGYGGSTGSPTESGLTLDALAAYDWLAGQGISGGSIVAVGESLGSAVALKLAAARRVAAVVIEAPFTSIADMAQHVYWFVPARLLVKDRFDSLRLVEKLEIPLFIAHGTEDEVVPFAMGEELAKSAPQAEFLAIPGGSHGSILTASTWAKELEFIERALKIAR